jgi:hypothetical protein
MAWQIIAGPETFRGYWVFTRSGNTWLAHNREHDSTPISRQDGLEVEQGWHLHSLLGLLSRLNKLPSMATHLEGLGTTTCQILPLDCEPRPLLDGRQAGKKRAAAPPQMPPLWPVTRNAGPPIYRMPLLAADLARGPSLALHSLQSAIQRNIAWLVAHSKAGNPEVDVKGSRHRSPPNAMDDLEASKWLRLRASTTFHLQPSRAHQRGSNNLGQSRGKGAERYNTDDLGRALVLCTVTLMCVPPRRLVLNSYLFNEMKRKESFAFSQKSIV